MSPAWYEEGLRTGWEDLGLGGAPLALQPGGTDGYLFTEVPVTARWGLSAGHHGATTGAAPPNFFFEGGQVTPLSWKCPEVWGCTA